MKIAVFHNLRGGGARRVFIEFGKRLSKRHLLDIYTLNNEGNDDFGFAYNIKVFPFSLSKNFLMSQKQILFDLPRVHHKIADEINKTGYDIACVHHDIYTKSPYLLRYLRIPSFYFCHEPPREFYEKFSLFSSNLKLKIVNVLRYYLKFIDRQNVKRADVVITNSKYSKSRINNIYDRKSKRVKLGVDTKIFRFLGIQRKNFFLTVGALAFFKGHELLIKSIAALPSDFRYPLIIISQDKQGRDEIAIKKIARDLKVKLKIVDVKTDEELVNYYNQARLCLLAPHYEPFGLVSIEAMSCGLPVVGVKEGGLIETVINNYGLLSERNTFSFSKAILKALNERLDKKRSMSLRKYVEKEWNWEKGTKCLEKMFIKYKR